MTDKNWILAFYLLGITPVALAERVIVTPINSWYNYHNGSGENLRTTCTIINPSPISQTVVVTVLNLGTSNNTASNLGQAMSYNRASEPSVVLGSGQAVNYEWGSSEGFSLAGVEVRITGDTGFLSGECHQYYNSGNGTRGIVMNGGRPF